MHALLVSSDLMLMASAQGAADRHGVLLTAAGDSEQALAACSDEAMRLVLIDLRLPGLDVAEFVRSVRGAKPQAARVAACGPHVHTHALAAAAEAGCDEVITRGEFDRRVDALFAELTVRAAKVPPAER